MSTPAAKQKYQDQIKALQDILQEDPPEDCEHALFHCMKGDLPTLRQRWHDDMCAIFDKYGPSIPETGKRDNDRQKDLETPPQLLAWPALDLTQQIQISLGTLPISTWTFPGRKAEFRKEKRTAFKQEITGRCATYALQICRVLRNYRKAVVADVQTKNKHWDAVNRSFDWGPLMDETSDDDDDEADNDE